jgi:hypothetical protein
MKVEGKIPVKLKGMNGTKRELTWLGISLVGLATCVLLLDVYIVRELLLFVACAALLVFFAANLALLGILFHAVGRSFLQSVRQAKTRVAQQVEAHAENLVGSLVASPTSSGSRNR